MTALRQRMLEDMQIRHLSPHTQRAYIENVARFAQHFHRSPTALGPEEIRTYQVYLTCERQLAPSSIEIAVCALRFLYKVTLQKAWLFKGRDPRPEKAAALAGGPQPRRSGPFSHLCRASRASDDPDDLLRRRPAHLGSRPPPADRTVRLTCPPKL